MSQCLCSVRQPCPIHKDKPLEIPDTVCHHTWVVRVHHVWSEKKWYAELAKDALLVQTTDKFDTKREAIEAVKL